MDIFVRNVPANATQKQLDKHFKAPFSECGISVFHSQKMRGKPLAIITVLDKEAGQRFLNLYGVPPKSPPHSRPVKSLVWDGKYLQCTLSRTKPSDFSVRSLKYEASQQIARAAAVDDAQKTKDVTRFDLCKLQCGTWDYVGSQLCFIAHFNGDTSSGSVTFGYSQVIILLGHSGSGQTRIDINYRDADNIILGTYQDPTLTFSLNKAPKFYEVRNVGLLSAAMSTMTLRSPRAISVTKSRLLGIDNVHEKIAGIAFVYRITLRERSMLSAVNTLLSRNAKMPPRLSLSTHVIGPIEALDTSFVRMNHELTDTGRFGGKPFSIRYQLTRLATNAVLSPLMVIQLLSQVQLLLDKHGLDATLSALRCFFREVPIPGPDVEAAELSKSALEQLLEDCAARYNQHALDNPYELSKRHTHINLIHRVVVTPTGTYLEGPEPEPTNRVLRRYSDQVDHFIRVVFQDEDGGSVCYDPRASQEAVYRLRFKAVLDKSILIAGRSFSFLGFSHSSLRLQSCWFQAPIVRGGTLWLADHIIKELGDFSCIRVPAKCAARIGQNFTDTNATLDVKPSEVGELIMVQRNGRDFSDGVGTISEDLLRSVWRVYGTRRLLKPTVLQIRFQGAKGVVSLDSRLKGRRLMLRRNMKKFETTTSWNLEICGAAFRPLPMILNRQLIKILEDLGISRDVFLHLQKIAVDELRLMTVSAINTSLFLEEMEITKATRLPSLIKLLDDIGLDYHQDHFLYSVVEIAVVIKLQDIKYRGRIPVPGGQTLYGIMDETGVLREGEVYVTIERGPEGGRQVWEKNGIIVTRSPARHPGDVQRVNAVDVPKDSPLQRLSNVVVFSQHGGRDLASQLSGGDLDGDLYNVIHDPELLPRRTCIAADYPRVTPKELDRTVETKDMSDFFVTFMETDQLGMLSNIHTQLADQSPQGTFDKACLKLAGMCSTAVDYSKTGIPVNMRDCPRYERCRPDFMAPSPRVVISEKGFLDLEGDDNHDDETFEELDEERQPLRYYKSEKTLGHLYRAIDEKRFLAKMQEQHRIAAADYAPSANLLDQLLANVERWASDWRILFQHHEVLARDIRFTYEDSLQNILYYYGPTAKTPLSEAEAFAGTILGRQGGAQGKSLRELSKTLRERFETVVEYTVMRIIKGDKEMQVAGDLDDLLYDERETEALPRAIACLSVAVTEPGWSDRNIGGELKSFKYVAAGVCLQELERYRITVFGLHGPLPKGV